ncbi:MAG TPA: hypothetical protein VFA83_17280 [Acidimicrobiales bacterium]|nr:hypothetical protein [Acidimicrobiales bacterium]
MNTNRVRVVAVFLIVVAFVALTAFALLARAYRPARSGVRVPAALASQPSTQLVQSAAAAVPAGAVLGTRIEYTDVAAPSVASAPAAPAPAPAPATPAPSTPPPPPSTNGLAPCPLGLATPTQPAGLANLVGLVPLFGPFSPEAFAMMPAFGPAFPLFGPLIVAGGKQLDAHAAEMNTLVGVVHPLEQQGFDAMSPLYGPYRQQFLDGEASVAGALQPGVTAFANAPGASCFPAALSAAGVG